MKKTLHFPPVTFFIRFLTICALVFSLSACQKELYQDLSEQQVNEMLALLLKYEMQAEKVAQGKGLFTLTIEEKQLIQALEILNKNNLPRPSYTNLGEIFKGDGMISSSTEENARMAYAISQELTNTFAQIDGVLTARVHIVLGGINQTTDEYTPPSAAVFLRHTSESPVVNYLANIKEITAKAVPNLVFDDISVMLVPVREEVSVPMRQTLSLFEIVNKSPYGLLLAAVLGIICLAGIIYLAVTAKSAYQHYKNKKEQQNNNE